jgi:hypothetical protein
MRNDVFAGLSSLGVLVVDNPDYYQKPLPLGTLQGGFTHLLQPENPETE